MRILFISTFYPPFVVGGWEQLVEDLNRGLRRRGHETYVLASTHGVPGSAGPSHQEHGVDRSLLLESNLQFYRPADMFSYGRRTQHNLDATRTAIERFQPDVIFVHIMWNLSRCIPWLAEQLAPRRVVYYVADHWAYSPDPHEAYWRDAPGNPFRHALKRLVAPLPLHVVRRDRRRFELAFDRVLCVSEAIRRSMLENLPSLNPLNVQVVYNGIDLTVFPFQERATLRHQDGLRLLYAGSLVPHKGVHVAVAAMGELARRGALGHLQLTIVGAGRPDYESSLHQAVENFGLQDRVHFVGRVPRSEMPRYLAAHDVLIFPSEWPEPLARMTQEAMASGLVVIGTTTGGTGEILVDDCTGLVFPPGNAVELATRILRLQSDPVLFEHLAAAGRRRVEEKFDLERMLTKVEGVLHATASPADYAAPAAPAATDRGANLAHNMAELP